MNNDVAIIEDLCQRQDRADHWIECGTGDFPCRYATASDPPEVSNAGEKVVVVLVV